MAFNLSDTQLARFQRDGYLIVERLFDREEIDLLGRIARADSARQRGRQPPRRRRGRHPTLRPQRAGRRHLQCVRPVPADRRHHGTAARR